MYCSAHPNITGDMEPVKNVILPVRSAVGMVLSPVLPVWPLLFWPLQVFAALAVRLDITLMKTECAKCVTVSV